ncbi:unnamed protein product [Arabidopsis halleri]
MVFQYGTVVNGVETDKRLLVGEAERRDGLILGDDGQQLSGYGVSTVLRTVFSEGQGSKSISPGLPLQQCSTVLRTGFSEAVSSGTFLKNGKPRKRPFKSRRRKTVKGIVTVLDQVSIPVLGNEVNVRID